jgi:hypothetical protein
MESFAFAAADRSLLKWVRRLLAARVVYSTTTAASAALETALLMPALQTPYSDLNIKSASVLVSLGSCTAVTWSAPGGLGTAKVSLRAAIATMLSGSVGMPPDTPSGRDADNVVCFTTKNELVEGDAGPA